MSSHYDVFAMLSAAGNKLIADHIRNYYKSVHNIVPDKFEQREFGFGTFESKIAFRHMAFKSEAEFEKYLVNTAPPFVDYSAAYYKYPDARPMDRKGWLGSELRFDIDANDIPTPCKLDHGKDWICEKCLEATKREVIKLMEDFLMADFGFSEKEMEVNFSGNRGYHLHVRKESIMMLDTNAREEMSSYIFGQEPNFDRFFTKDYAENQRGRQVGPRPSDGGWRRKVAQAFLDAAYSKDSLTALGIDKDTASWIFRNSLKVRTEIKGGNWDFHPIPHRDEILGNLVHNQAIKQGNRIDKGVTRDPSHLMRLPNTIHGGAGLIAKKLSSRADLDSFNPLKDAVAFKEGEIKVKANSRYKLVINNQEFGPFKDEIVTLPTYAATYLYLKGQADMLTTS
jgi:DNA primase small subunit